MQPKRVFFSSKGNHSVAIANTHTHTHAHSIYALHTDEYF